MAYFIQWLVELHLYSTNLSIDFKIDGLAQEVQKLWYLCTKSPQSCAKPSSWFQGKINLSTNNFKHKKIKNMPQYSRANKNHKRSNLWAIKCLQGLAIFWAKIWTRIVWKSFSKAIELLLLIITNIVNL